MKGASFGVGFLLLFVGGTFLGAAAAFGFNTSDAIPFGIASGVCLAMSAVSLWRAHRKGEDEINVYDYLTSLRENSEKE